MNNVDRLLLHAAGKPALDAVWLYHAHASDRWCDRPALCPRWALRWSLGHRLRGESGHRRVVGGTRDRHVRRLRRRPAVGHCLLRRRPTNVIQLSRCDRRAPGQRRLAGRTGWALRHRSRRTRPSLFCSRRCRVSRSVFMVRLCAEPRFRSASRSGLRAVGLSSEACDAASSAELSTPLTWHICSPARWHIGISTWTS